VVERHPTTKRLIAEALRLFANDGVGATPIVKIEEAAGLASGSGAFYKHFRSKAELLEAAVEDAASATLVGEELFRAVEGLSVADQARFIARGTWLMFDSHRDLFLVIAREYGDRPRGYSQKPGGWPGEGPAFVAAWLTQCVASGELVVSDPRATAVVLLDALTAYWAQRETESPTPYGVDGDRFIESWVELVMGLSPRRKRAR
jgi:AcrR family transcriptional regulator